MAGLLLPAIVKDSGVSGKRSSTGLGGQIARDKCYMIRAFSDDDCHRVPIPRKHGCIV